ncbi:hypothetical protein BsWGS_00570 [Bradybaena similaris]
MKILPSAGNLFFIQGKPLAITCTVYGDENVEVTWMKLGSPLVGDEYQIESWNDEDKEGRRKNVKISKAVAGPQDTTTFQCFAGGVDETVWTTDVYMFTRDANITEGSDSTLTCRVELAYLNKTIKWLKGGTPLEDVPDLKGRLEFGNDTVVFRNAKLTDTGVYTCRLELGGPEGSSQVFEEKVVLQGKPYIANLNNPEQNQQVTNTSILLKCPAGGYPPPTVFWFRDSDVIQPSSRIYLNQLNDQSSGQLEIPNATEADYGQYKCTAENALGRETFTFDLTGSSVSNSAIKVLLCLKDVCGLFVVVSFASLKLALSR